MSPDAVAGRLGPSRHLGVVAGVVVLLLRHRLLVVHEAEMAIAVRPLQVGGDAVARLARSRPVYAPA